MEVGSEIGRERDGEVGSYMVGRERDVEVGSYMVR